ncbi:MAG: AMP-binding protein, partial [Oscillospiraceae bacterium]
MKIGALACPIFEAFMERAVYERVYDCSAKVLITTIDMLYRIPIDQLPDLETIYIASDYIGKFKEPFIHSLKPLVQAASDEFEVQFVGENDPMLLCYTSGSTGKPKGILLSHKGVMMQAYQTGKFVLDLKPDDIYWCTADPGWVTGAVYSLLTPWLHGIQAILAGGRFKAENWYRNLQDYKVTVWYSAPTALRLLMSSDPSIAKRFDISSVRNIYSVGEPLNPEVIRWAMAEFGIRIHDTWFMTETGSQMVCNYPCMPIKPGSMGKPIPGVEVALMDNHHNLIGNNIMGTLVVKKGWPAMMSAVWGSEEKYNSYFVGENNEWYSSGDTAYRDDDGYYWYQGRIDDVINTSGERVGPFEVESKLLEHPAVIEAGVIGIPDPTRGQIIKAFVTLSDGYVPSDALKKELRDFVKLGLAAHAAPREFAFCDSLPKTRSGKIMRRVLKARELGLPEGDLSSMDDD